MLCVLCAIALPDLPPTLAVTATPASSLATARPTVAIKPMLSPEAASQPQFSPPRLAQAVVPNADGTGTVVTPEGNQIDITGGQLSGDGANLFHSFQEFGLTAEQVANFIASPDIQNILSSVNGGNASVINGLLQVSGSNANLYLINPAGVIFGPQGAIDLTGSFTATTANQVGFGDHWLDVLHPSEYQALTGTPNGFAFTGDAGTVLNLGNLTANPGQNITLLGREVINLGTIDAPAGTITLAAIPSENLVRISQENQLLSLEIAPPLTATGQLALDPLALPTLLTGSALTHNDLTVVQEADGTVRLESATATATLELGSVIASGEITTEGANGGQIYLLGQQVTLLNADVNASGLFGGGDIRIGGDIQGQGSLPLATVTQIDTTSTLTADALQLGDGGNLVVWGSELAVVDGLLTARGGAEAGNGGLIETSGDRLELSHTPDASAANGNGGTWLIDPTDITIVASGGGPIGSTVIAATAINTALDAGMNVSIVTSSSGSDAGNITLAAGATLEKTMGNAAMLSLSAINDILLNDSVQFGGGGPLTLDLTADADGDGNGAIIAGAGNRLESGGGDVNLAGVGISVGAIDTTFPLTAGGAVTLNSGSDIIFESIDTSTENSVSTGGNVTLSAEGTVIGSGTVTSTNPPFAPPDTTIFTQGLAGNGAVTIQHDGGPNNQPFVIGDAAVNGTAGAIAADSILTDGTFDVQPTGGSDTPAANITITSINTPPTLSLTTALPEVELNQSTVFTLADLNPTVADANSDVTTLAVVSVPAGTLLQNGTPVQPGDAIAPTDTLEFIPPPDTSGALTAFTLQAEDGVANSAPVNVAITILEPSQPPPSTSSPVPDVTTLDPTLGIRTSAPPQPLSREQTAIVGMPLAASPQLEELSVLGMVLPEPGYLIVDAIQVNAATNGLFPLDAANAPAANFPSLDLTAATEPPAGQPQGTGPNLLLPTEPIVPIPAEVPTDGTPDPGPAIEPITPDSIPEPVDPALPPEPVDPSSSPAPATDAADSPAGPAAEAAETPADATEAGDEGSVALQPSDQTDLSPRPVSPVAQGLKNCQAEAQDLQATAASDRTQSLYASLIDCYAANLATATEQGDAHWVGYSLNNLAISHFVIGDYLTALDLHQQQLEQAQALRDRTQEGIALGGIGATYAALGDYATAIDFYEQSLRVMPMATAPQWKALTYRNLGNAYFATQDYAKAADQQLTSLDISRGAGDTYGEMQAYGNLGSTRAIQGQFAAAITLYEKGLALAEALNNDLETAQLLLGISTTYAYQQHYEQAYRYGQAALQITRQVGASLGEGIALTNLGNALLYLERLTEAEQVLFDAVTVWEAVRAGLGTSDGFKISIFETQLVAYRNLQEVLVAQNKTDTALTVAERGRARAFVELLARGEAHTTAAGTPPPPNLAQMQRIAAAQNATLVEYSIIRDQFADPPHAASVQNPIEPQDARLYIWVIAPDGRIEFRQVSLQDQSPTAIADLVTATRTAMVGRDDFIVAADRGLAVVPTSERPLRPGDFVQREGDLPDLAPYEVISVSPDGQTVTVSHPDFVLPDPALPASELYRVEPVGAIAQPTLQQLHDLLIAPIADLLPPNPDDLVIFVPQEHLFLVPFAALQNAQGTYLIEQHTIAVTPSIQVLELTGTGAGSRGATTATEALVVGNPSPMPGTFAPLPNAETEAAVVAEALAANPLLRDAATEAEVKAALPQADIIHLATHGQFNSTHPLQGAIALAPDAQNDGLLTAAEILEQPLKASLAILSACDTGRGRITGDGVIGLSRSFMAAGVPQVIVSLWQVPDAQTAELMIAFHAARQQGDRPPQALRQAMLTALETEPDPYFWSAFTQVGNLQ